MFLQNRIQNVAVYYLWGLTQEDKNYCHVDEFIHGNQMDLIC